MNVVTITLHPAIDKVLKIKRLRPNDTARSSIEMIYGGGKGNNVARSLTRLNNFYNLGMQVIASGFQGGLSGEFITRAICAEGILTHFAVCQNPTRTSLLIHEEETSLTYAIYEPGQDVSLDEIHSLEDIFSQLLECASLCLFCGSGQTSLLADVFPTMIKMAVKRGVWTILDSSGLALVRGVEAKPTLLKINQDELAELSHIPIGDMNDQIRAIQSLCREGIPLVVLTRGSQGMLISDGNETWCAALPMENVINIVGCGDSLLAGISTAWLEHCSLPEIARWGTACGAANTQSTGAGFIDPALVSILLPQVRVERV